eukprot:1680200-Heterocapsa_arctica.AAC.1
MQIAEPCMRVYAAVSPGLQDGGCSGVRGKSCQVERALPRSDLHPYPSAQFDASVRDEEAA